jgi:hypothetical protein
MHKPLTIRHAQATDNEACTSRLFFLFVGLLLLLKKILPSQKGERGEGEGGRERDLGERGREWCCKMCRDATKASLNSNATPNRRKWKRFGYWKICRERGERGTL